jgi:DNA-directed RNA polymerase subunit M/transcription elongation factor TFIIS
MDENLVTAMAFSTLWEAEMALSRLESEDIPAYLKDGHTVNMNWLLSNAVGGVKVQVADVDLKRAKKVLTTPLIVDVQEESDPEDVIVCPRCRNENIQYEISGRRWTFMTWVLCGIPLIWPRKRLYCSRCGYRWRDSE